ncbi:glycine/betaine ABC transporter permease, partial [Enterobacter sp. J49]
HGCRNAALPGRHRRHRRLVAGDGHAGAGADRTVLLHPYRPAARHLAGAQQARRQSHQATARRDADHSGLRLSGADRHAVRYRQRAGRGRDHYLRAAADRAPDHS